jgi:hypothetical protein
MLPSVRLQLTIAKCDNTFLQILWLHLLKTEKHSNYLDASERAITQGPRRLKVVHERRYPTIFSLVQLLSYRHVERC